MMKFKMASEPCSFYANVKLPGLSAINELVGKPPLIIRPGPRRAKKYQSEDDIPSEEFPAYWASCIPDLLNAYNDICQYSCFLIPSVTGSPSVDHMIPKSLNWQHVYEWSNYRLAAASLNSRKNKFIDVLDPFEVEDDWFAIEFYCYQVVVGPGVTDAALLDKVNASIERLNLNHISMRRKRAEIVEKYVEGKINRDEFISMAPFLAREYFEYEKDSPEPVIGKLFGRPRCPLCHFKGEHNGRSCDYCDGSGQVSEQKFSEYNELDYRNVKCPKCEIQFKHNCDACLGTRLIYKKYADNSNY